MNTKNNQLMKDWIEVLRSGEYKQDTCQLKTSNGYCCLGVAVMVHPEWNISKKHKRYMSVLNKEVGQENEFPPVEVLHDLNVSLDDARKLIRMNDIELKSFNEIADYIEKELLQDE